MDEQEEPLTHSDESGVYSEDEELICDLCYRDLPAHEWIMYVNDDVDLCGPTTFYENEYPVCLECATGVFVERLTGVLGDGE